MLGRFNRRVDLWLPTYLLTSASRFFGHLVRRNKLTHIMFLVCDHYEPRHAIKQSEQAFDRVRTWQREYAHFQDRCRAAFGAAPVHTWFYPPHHGIEHLASLSEMVFDGMGEVELHYHHQDDTEETLFHDLTTVVSDYARWGHLLQSGEVPRTSFGFIHGDWALGNSGHGKYCGVNDELTILQKLGCWADFTMPSGNVCQTRKINSIYYAKGSRERPKSHDWGQDAQVGRTPPEGMFLMQGPLGINWGAPNHPRVENASLTTRNWGRLDRIRKWLDCNIHVKGRPEWLFVKLHAHGAVERDFDAMFGETAFEMHRLLNEQFNDKKKYQLHYVTARQAYNIAKAAESGKQGDPGDWKDYLIPPQPHAFYTLNAAHDLKCCTPDRLTVDMIDNTSATVMTLRSRVGPVMEITGPCHAIDIDCEASQVAMTAKTDGTEITLRMNAEFQLLNIEDGRVLESISAAGAISHRLIIGKHCHFGYSREAGNKPVSMPAEQRATA